jgi:hypothetical protein
MGCILYQRLSSVQVNNALYSNEISLFCARTTFILFIAVSGLDKAVASCTSLFSANKEFVVYSVGELQIINAKNCGFDIWTAIWKH